MNTYQVAHSAGCLHNKHCRHDRDDADGHRWHLRGVCTQENQKKDTQATNEGKANAIDARTQKYRPEEGDDLKDGDDQFGYPIAAGCPTGLFHIRLGGRIGQAPIGHGC